MQKYYFKEKLKALTPNCRTLRDFLSWSVVKRLSAFFVLRGYAILIARFFN